MPHCAPSRSSTSEAKAGRLRRGCEKAREAGFLPCVLARCALMIRGESTRDPSGSESGQREREWIS
eukprot:2674742-Rhodomonas_salina.1